jgi:AcrR family transcriptional regulator
MVAMERSAFRARSPLRQELLDAAARLIVERGYRRMRMQDVAASAAVSRQTVYNEFGDKWGLAKALMLRENDRYLDGVSRALTRHTELYAAVAAAVSYTLETASEDPLKKAVLTGAGDGELHLLPLLTTEAEPLIFAAQDRIARQVSRRWPRLASNEVAAITEMVVRLTVSHIVSPTDPPEIVAHQLARLTVLYLGEPVPEERPAKRP